MQVDFMALAAAHLLVSLIYYILVRAKTGNNTQSFSEGVIVLVMPVFGVIFLLGVRLSKLCATPGERMTVDVYSKSPGAQRLILGEHEKYEDDVISLNDVLAMDDAQQKRVLLTDAVKQNVLSNKDVLRKAIKDSDREVSHYAVSMVTTMVESIEKKLFDLNKKLEDRPDDEELLTEYVANMDEYLKVCYLDEVSRRSSEEAYNGALERLIEHSPDDPKLYETKIDYELSFGNFDKAELYCRKFAQKYPLLEQPFLSYMKLYQQIRDLNKFRAKMDELKKCPIQLTPRALGIIRFWNEEASRV
jgi:tetratricopeptide (TPR) repeat protein